MAGSECGRAAALSQDVTGGRSSIPCCHQHRPSCRSCVPHSQTHMQTQKSFPSSEKQSGQKHPRDVALFGKTLGMFRGEECCAQPPTRHTLHPRTEINGTPEGGSMENHQMQLSASSSATDCDIRTGKDVRHNLLVIHMDASLPPSFSPPQCLNRGQACTLRLVF